MKLGSLHDRDDGEHTSFGVLEISDILVTEDAIFLGINPFDRGYRVSPAVLVATGMQGHTVFSLRYTHALVMLDLRKLGEAKLTECIFP